MSSFKLSAKNNLQTCNSLVLRTAPIFFADTFLTIHLITKLITSADSPDKIESICIFKLPNSSTIKNIFVFLWLLHNVSHLETKTRPCKITCFCTVWKWGWCSLSQSDCRITVQTQQCTSRSGRLMFKDVHYYPYLLNSNIVYDSYGYIMKIFHFCKTSWLK